MILERISNYLNNNNYNLNISKNHIYINNFDKIDNITDKLINIVIEDTKVEIKGINIKIKKMVEKEALFSGEIESIVFKNN